MWDRVAVPNLRVTPVFCPTEFPNPDKTVDALLPRGCPAFTTNSHLIGMAPRSKKPPASQLPLASGSLKELAEESRKCRNCDLWRNATQTVFGEGSTSAPIMLIGEVPGDQEDQQGKPFVGPAGMLLRAMLKQAGIDLKQVYLTNVVKHFKWEPRGKRRIHKTPNASEIKACRFWLDAEIAHLKPKVIVCLGATAAQALLGRDFRVTQRRGELIDSSLAPHVMTTVHPSSILRAPDEGSRHQQEREFLADLKKVAAIIFK
jgi:uracil-DNA glycosylase